MYYYFSFPLQKNQLINTLTKYTMLLFFIILPEQQGYRDNSCWLPPFRLRRVLSAILKKSRHKQSAVRSFPVVSGRYRYYVAPLPNCQFIKTRPLCVSAVTAHLTSLSKEIRRVRTQRAYCKSPASKLDLVQANQ